MPGNPGGSPGGQFYPPPPFSEGTWSRFLLEYGAPLVVGGPLIRPGLRVYGAVSGWILRRGVARTIASTTYGTSTTGLISGHRDLANLERNLSWLEFGLTHVENPFIVEGSSSHDLVQNGGPPALLLPSGSPSSEANGSATSSAGGDSAHGRGSADASGRRRRCPKGHYWDKRLKRCRRIATIPKDFWEERNRFHRILTRKR